MYMARRLSEIHETCKERENGRDGRRRESEREGEKDWKGSIRVSREGG